MNVRPATLAALLLAVLALFAAGCGGDDEESSATPTATATTAETEAEPAEESEEEREREEQEAADAGGKECPKDLDGEPERKPPSDVVVPAYAHVYKSEGPFGKTERFYAVLDGTPEDLASRRDDAQNELVQVSSYQSLSTDEEEGAEAEAHLKGSKHTVDIQVAPLCEGEIRIRYTVQ